MADTAKNQTSNNDQDNLPRDEQGRVDEAISHFQKSLETKSDGAEAEFCLGSALLQKGRESEAILHFQRKSKGVKPRRRTRT